MLKGKQLVIINISLALIAVFLTLNLFGVTLPTLGEALYSLDSEEPLSIVRWQDQYSVCSDLPRCCLEARKQGKCFFDPLNTPEGHTDWACRSSNENVLTYLFNNKAYHYCTQQWGN